MSSQCRAKDPLTCYWHGTPSRTTVQLKTDANKAASEGKYAEYYKIREEIKVREAAEKEAQRASWGADEKSAALSSLLTSITASGDKVTETSPGEYEATSSEQLKQIADSLEDDEVQIEVEYSVSGYEVIKEVHIPILNTSIINSNENEEIRENIPASALSDDHWYDG